MRRVFRLLLFASLGACDDAFEPTVQNVSGLYEAMTFTATDASGRTDLLVGSNEFTLTLDTNRTVTGHLFLAGVGEGGADIDADMAGTWHLTGRIVTFDQAADTFVRDVEFTADEGVLRAQFVDAGRSVSLRLVRS